MEDKIKVIIEKMIRSGIDMNAFLKASGVSIKEKIEAVTYTYYRKIKKEKYNRKKLKFR
ncbi:MAG: hypothetical protein V3581_04400 [Candidatus Cardinium sp.]